jgi:hypothetical protein
VLRPARSRRWPDPSAEVLAGGGAALGLVLIGVGMAVHLAAGPTALQLVLAVAALAVRPLAVLTHRRSSSQPASTTHHEPTGVP